MTSNSRDISSKVIGYTSTELGSLVMNYIVLRDMFPLKEVPEEKRFDSTDLDSTWEPNRIVSGLMDKVKKHNPEDYSRFVKDIGSSLVSAFYNIVLGDTPDKYKEKLSTLSGYSESLGVIFQILNKMDNREHWLKQLEGSFDSEKIKRVSSEKIEIPVVWLLQRHLDDYSKDNK